MLRKFGAIRYVALLVNLLVKYTGLSLKFRGI